MKSVTSQIGYSEKAYTHLRESILRGELRPAHPISELEYSAFLKMSRTPVSGSYPSPDRRGSSGAPAGTGDICSEPVKGRSLLSI